MIKLNKGIHIIPYFFIACMKYMSTIFMHINTFYTFGINIPSDVIAFINYQAFATSLFNFMRKNRSE